MLNKLTLTLALTFPVSLFIRTFALLGGGVRSGDLEEPLLPLCLVEDILGLHPGLDAHGVPARLTPAPRLDAHLAQRVQLTLEGRWRRRDLVDPTEKGPERRSVCNFSTLRRVSVSTAYSARSAFF